MRIPLTPHGRRELLMYGGALLALTVLGAWLWLPSAAVPFLLLLFVLSFFRDPERVPPGGPETAVAPADGRVTDIDTVDEPHFVGGQALRIGIFLSVFNVHVNRAPLDGRVVGMRYKPGKFLDVRDPRSRDLNESNLIGFEGERGRFAVRQVAGLVARRIVWPFEAGAVLARGQRAGMIKFGSRTELFVPVEWGAEVLVELGQMVKGGATPLLRLP